MLQSVLLDFGQSRSQRSTIRANYFLGEGESHLMYPDELYNAALAFRKTKLWKSLYDSELFAVSLSNGEIGYCCVMGYLGEHIALSLYIGNHGLDSYRLLQELGDREMNYLKAQEFMLCQSCLQCSFESKETLAPKELASARAYAATHHVAFRGANAFPQFVSYQPAHHPWQISEEEDIELLCEALEAALEVNERLQKTDKTQLGFREGPAFDRAIPLLTQAGGKFNWELHQLPPKQPPSYPEPALQDELLMMRLKKTRKHPASWVCDVVMTPEPVLPEDGTVPIFPYMLLTADAQTGLVLPTDVVADYEADAGQLIQAIGNIMVREGVPRQIIVVDDRTYALLKNLTEMLKIKLVQQRENTLLDALEDDLLEFCGNQASNSETGQEYDFFGRFMDLDDDEILSMPDELWHQLLALEHQGLLSDDVAMRVRALSKRRY